jgi:membrane glycosyltransferase
MCEQETFLSLMKNAAHWEFELFLMFLFDIVLGLIVWPFISSIIRKKALHHESDDDKIARLEEQVRMMKDFRAAQKWDADNKVRKNR